MAKTKTQAAKAVVRKQAGPHPYDPEIVVMLTPGRDAKRAVVELRFSQGLLAGLKMIGLYVWQSEHGRPNVTWPTRSVVRSPGDVITRSALWPMSDNMLDYNGLRDAILQVYEAARAEGQTEMFQPQEG